MRATQLRSAPLLKEGKKGQRQGEGNLGRFWVARTPAGHDIWR
jgi:hypothetical protein